jgi:predicted amidohydrolase YtcJ
MLTTAERIFHNGPIITVDDDTPTAEAVAVAGGRIVRVGDLAGMAEIQGPDTDMVDLAGRTLVPGLIDGHAHANAFGSQAVGAILLAPPDGDVNTVDDVVARLAEFAAGPDVDKSGWVFGLGYDDSLIGSHPTRDDLDKVSTEVPVLAAHISAHMCAVNSKALEMAGITADSADPQGGIIRRREGSQEPDGVLIELAGIPLIMQAIFPTDPAAIEYFAKRGLEMAKRYGYTTMHDGRAFGPNHQGMVANAGKGIYDVDMLSYIDYKFKDLITAPWFGEGYHDRYRVAGVKLTLDGSPQGRTAWRTIPYLIPPEGEDADYVGVPVVPDDEVQETVNWAYENGVQILVHANGDAAIDQFINAVRVATEKYGPGDRRTTLIHGQFVRLDQLDACAELGIMPSLFPMHTFYWGDWYDEIIGPELAQQISPTRSALDRMPRITSHTDAPIVLPNLMNIMSATVNRTSRSGKVMGPNERLTPLEALKCLTIWSAYQHFEEDNKGSITEGKLADLVILSDNPLTIDPMLLNTITVRETIKEGQTVYAA